MSTTTNEPVISQEKTVSPMGKPRRKQNGGEVLPKQSVPPEESPKEEDPLIVRSISDLNPVQKIELLNAYKALYDDVPPTADDQRVWIYNILKTGYQAWVNERIQELFGVGKTQALSVGQFNDAEVAALKALAQAVQQKKQAPAAPVQPVKSTPSLPRQPQPPVNTTAYIKSQEDFLQQLAKLDREGPEF
jgi:hypothetical protein